MSRKNLIILQIVLWSCIIVFLTGIFVYASFTNHEEMTIALTGKGHELNYEVPLENMNEIEVDLVNQDIYIYETDEPVLIVKQVANRRIPEDEKLRLVQYEHKVRVEKKNNIGFKVFNFGNWSFNERVEIYVPATYKQLLNLKTVSGTIKMDNVIVDEIECQTTSGDIEMINVTAKEMKINTTSGDIKVENIEIDSLEGVSTSGDLEIEGMCNNVEGKTVSGNIELELMQHPKQIRVESVSGDIDLNFAKMNGFDLEFNSTSGDFESDFDVIAKSKKKYSYKDESAKLRVKTVSGNLEIN